MTSGLIKLFSPLENRIHLLFFSIKLSCILFLLLRGNVRPYVVCPLGLGDGNWKACELWNRVTPEKESSPATVG